ncbi:MAG: hypothetical protein ACOCUL_05215, partial [Bacteroidota bacterium]
TLNKVLSMKDKKNVPETILPSQLFLLHNSSIEKDENDIKQFVKFIKKRTTEFKLNGSEALRFIEEIRDVTSDINELTSILKAYSDTKYKATYEEVKKYNKVSTFNEFAQGKIDKELWEAKKGDTKYKDALERAIIKLKGKFKMSIKLAYTTEFVIYILIGWIIQIISGNEKISILTSLGLIIISVGVSFIFKDSFGVHKFFKTRIFDFFIKNSHFYKTFGNDELFIMKTEDIINEA